MSHVKGKGVLYTSERTKDHEGLSGSLHVDLESLCISMKL